MDRDRLFTVSLSIPQLGGSSHEDAAETFVRVVRDWLAGYVKALFLEVTDEYASVYDAGTKRIIEIKASEVQ